MVVLPLVPAIAGMERAGIKVEREELARQSGDYASEIMRLEGEIHALAGRPFTIRSPQQLGEVLYGRMGLAGGKTGKPGAHSTEGNAQVRLAAQGATIARLVLDRRPLPKLISNSTHADQTKNNPAKDGKSEVY